MSYPDPGKKKLKLCEYGVCMTLFLDKDASPRNAAIQVSRTIHTQAGVDITPAELSRLEQQIARKLEEE